MKRALLAIALLLGLFLALSVLFYKADPNAQAATTVRPGDVVLIRATYACAPSEQSFDEIEKWIVRNDLDEVRRLMLRTHSFILRPDTEVKVLETGLLRAQVRVVGQLGEGNDVGDPRLNRECWTDGGAIRQSTRMEFR
jgi:hypothetical protein